jgi:N-acyl homoserine lactone hydrolase
MGARKFAGVKDMQPQPSTAAIIKAEGAPLQGVFMTHLHLDHVSGMPTFPRMSPSTLAPAKPKHRCS